MPPPPCFAVDMLYLKPFSLQIWKAEIFPKQDILNSSDLKNSVAGQAWLWCLFIYLVNVVSAAFKSSCNSFPVAVGLLLIYFTLQFSPDLSHDVYRQRGLKSIRLCSLFFVNILPNIHSFFLLFFLSLILLAEWGHWGIVVLLLSLRLTLINLFKLSKHFGRTPSTPHISYSKRQTTRACFFFFIDLCFIYWSIPACLFCIQLFVDSLIFFFLLELDFFFPKPLACCSHLFLFIPYNRELIPLDYKDQFERL